MVFIITTCVLTCYLYSLDPSTPVQALLMGCISGGVLSLFVPCAYQIKWRHDNGVDLFATLETDEEKLKEHMLFIMQYHGIEENLKELNEILRNYPQWHLEDWVVFRSWYKAQIDHMVKYPEIYGLRIKGTGEPYSTDKDPLYDPEAPDWELYDRPRYDDEEDDDNDDEPPKISSAAKDGLFFGIGFGAAEMLDK